MKKLLYGTTALVAAGCLANSAFAADKIQLGVGGYFQAVFAVGDEDDGDGEGADGRREHGLFREGEIIFNGKTTLDNGLEVGVQVQLEAETCDDQIDETFIYFEGAWGRLNVGQENSGAYLQHRGTSSVGLGLNSPNFRIWAAPAGAGATVTATPPNMTSDSEKLTYFTPRLFGFELSASYTPDNCEEANVANNAPPGAAGCGGSYSGFQFEENTGQQSEVIEISANYVQKFNDFSVAASASYGEADREGPDTTTTDDREEWSVGGELGYAGFAFGVAYREDNRGIDDDGDQDDFAVSLKYTTGPWGVSVMYAMTEREVTGGDEDEYEGFELAGSYNLGPGVTMIAGVQWADIEDAANDEAQENEAVIGYVGTKLNF